MSCVLSATVIALYPLVFVAITVLIIAACGFALVGLYQRCVDRKLFSRYKKMTFAVQQEQLEKLRRSIEADEAHLDEFDNDEYREHLRNTLTTAKSVISQTIQD